MKRITFIAFLTVMLASQCSKPSKPAYLWIDASANFEHLSTEDSIKVVMKKIRDAGVTAIIVDLKPISGEVIYSSKIADQALEWKGFTRDADFDYPAIMIREARKRRLKVYAAMNVFSEGWKSQNRGIIYTTHPEWQTMLNAPGGIVPTTEYRAGYSAFVNPALPDVQDYELSLMEEILTIYKFDGIILDRVRYDNIKSDFTDYSKQEFERYLGYEVANWPRDIYFWKLSQMGRWEMEVGVHFKEWLTWRTKVIYDFLNRAREQVKTINPKLQFASYVGAWYPTYYELGVNWASREYDPSETYAWASAEYKQYGYAELLDFLLTGCYFYHLTYEEMQAEYDGTTDFIQRAGLKKLLDPINTVEGSAQMSMNVTMGKIPVYGSIYVQKYIDREDPLQFEKAIRMCIDKTGGVMIFDLIHIIDFDWWDELKNGLKNK
ncbi:MAG: family 10 glycosylhydrolase [Candidatus Marinimicrobia bacterium]|nr:family 10 glycosylhydrolase [Candidatus Neomarinimicrobiota bacterium]